MLYVYQFDMAAIALLGVLICVFFIRGTYTNYAGLSYIAMIISALVASIADLLSAFTISYPERYSILVHYVVDTSYLFFYNITVIFFYLYVLCITGRFREGGFENIMWKVYTAIIVGLFLLNPFTGILFYFNDAGVYTHGSLFYLLHGMGIFMILAVAWLFFKYRKKLSLFQIISVCIFEVMIVASLAYQVVYWNQLISCFTVALVSVLIYTTLKNPSDYMYKTTNCFNHEAFIDRIENLMDVSKPYSALAVEFIDMEYIRPVVNADIFDQIVAEIIDRLQDAFGWKKVFCLTESRFIVLLETDDTQLYLEKAQVMRETFEKKFSYGSINLELTPEMCVIHYPEIDEKKDIIFREIQSALNDMASSKESGEIVHITDAVRSQGARTSMVRNALGRALADGGFKVFYQPLVDVETGKPAGAEAVLRLNDTELGNISPDEFIRVAEESGAIIEIGELVLREVCRFMKENNLKDYGMKGISVNLSMIQCMQHDLADRIISIVSEYGVNPRRIVLEITETAAASSSEKTINSNLNRLKNEGFELALDDYGSGFSTASYLMNLPVKFVKVDREFLWGAIEDSDAMIILSNLMRMVKQLNRKIVVEGVETEKMIEIAKAEGADYLQGFYFSKPIPEDEFLEYIKSPIQGSPDPLQES